MSEHARGPHCDDGQAAVPVPLLDLTDEELAVLAGADQGVIALPYLEELTGAARDQALRTAWRSMLARGLIEPPEDPQHPDAAVGLDLSALLHIRLGAPVLLCLQRTLSEQTLLRYVHLVDDMGLVEDVLPEGVHRFGWLDRGRLAAALQDFLVPRGAVAGTGGAITLAAEQLSEGQVDTDLLRVLGDPVVMADATVRYEGDDGPGTLLGITVGPGGCWVSRNEHASPEGAVRVRLDPVRPEDIGQLVVGLVQAAEAAERQVRAMRPP